MSGLSASALADGTTAVRAGPPRSIAANSIGLSVPRPRLSVGRLLLPILSLAADVGFVRFNDAGKRKLISARKHRSKSMQEMPTGSILDAHLARKTHGADRLGRAQHEIHGKIPDMERKVRSLHCCTDRDGELTSTGMATIEPRSSRNLGRLIDRATLGADRPIGPSHLFHVCATGLVSPEFLHKSRQLHALSYRRCRE